jgi:raffinose/stachyose/melibiose transport system permease protein
MRINSAIRGGIAAAMAATFALPLYLAFVSVFKTQQQILYHPMDLPNPPTLDNLWQVLSRPDQLIFKSLGTSLSITVVSVVCIVFLSSVTGYYIARQNSRLTQFLQALFLAGLMVPPQVTLIPVVRVFRVLGLMGTFQGVALVFIGGGLLSFAIFVYTGFVKNIPRELEEAAIVDGAGEFRLFWQVIFPLMRPATATVTIFLSLWTWNEFLIPLLILGPARGMTVTTGVYIALGEVSSIDYGQMFAMMFLSALPMLIFFFALQKEFIVGLTAGSLKG